MYFHKLKVFYDEVPGTFCRYFFIENFFKGNFMSDSKKTNELDSYGVWVKTPPKTVDSSDTIKDDTFDLNTDLPDFSELDVIDKPGDFSAPQSTGGYEEEISLDEFIEGGIFETGPDEDKIREKEAEKMSAQTQTSEVQDDVVTFEEPAEDFSVTADPVDESSDVDFGSVDNQSLSDDDIFNVDLSFDEAESGQSEADDFSSSSALVDLPGDNSSANDSPAGTEDVDLSEFGLDDLDFGSSESSDEPAGGSDDSVSEENDGMESVDLSEFGFDDGAEGEVSTPQDVSETGTAEDVNKADFKEEAEQEGAEEFSLEQEVTLDDEPVALEEEVTPVEKSSSDGSDDDFDLDSILDNITDENGNTVALGETSSTVDKTDYSSEDADNPVAITNAEIEALSLHSDSLTLEEPVDDLAESEKELSEPATELSEPATALSEPATGPLENLDIPGDEREAEMEVFEEPVIDSTFENTLEETAGQENLLEQEAAEPVFDTTEPSAEEPEIPDTFDEEAASFLETDDEKVAEIADSITAPILEEAEPEAQQPSAQMTALFSQIVTELSSLKNEISSLKSEFETIKNANQTEKLALEETAAVENEGFFSDSNEDDTIALSKDEMDNILNTADIAQADETGNQEVETVSTENLFGSPEETVDFAEEDVVSGEEEVASEDDFSMEFENAGEEPALEDVDYTTVAEDELPEEISVPKTEDILVESSPTDLLDAEETAETGETEPVLEEPELSTEDNPETEPAEILEEDPFGLSQEEPAITDTFIEEKMDYLSASPVEEEEIASATEEETVSEDGTEGSIPEMSASEVSASETRTDDSLSEDLKSEIKSVLSYMDQLLENLPENKIAEFAQSEQFDTYKKLFKELGLA